MVVLLTGVAGFIGSATALTLLQQGHHIIGIDNLNDYYEVSLKEARLLRLQSYKNFSFHKLDLATPDSLENLNLIAVTHIIHCAAQAGVRYSFLNPMAYLRSNCDATQLLFEKARHLPHLRRVVFASSSSVYGANTKVPYSVTDPVDHPISIYAATKRANELMAYTYARTYNLPMVGLRFFTVYGPFGRPDMAPFIFTRKILSGEPITLFKGGQMKRDFTYIDDITKGIVSSLESTIVSGTNEVPFRLYNLGNSHPEIISDFLGLLEKSLNKKTERLMAPMQPGEVEETYADIRSSQKDLGFSPTISIEEGIPLFVNWYRSFYNA